LYDALILHATALKNEIIYRFAASGVLCKTVGKGTALNWGQQTNPEV
jgi:hypothetical protein